LDVLVSHQAANFPSGGREKQGKPRDKLISCGPSDGAWFTQVRQLKKHDSDVAIVVDDGHLCWNMGLSSG
jgi:hypothetical protein